MQQLAIWVQSKGHFLIKDAFRACFLKVFNAKSNFAIAPGRVLDYLEGQATLSFIRSTTVKWVKHAFYVEFNLQEFKSPRWGQLQCPLELIRRIRIANWYKSLWTPWIMVAMVPIWIRVIVDKYVWLNPNRKSVSFMIILNIGTLLFRFASGT